MQQPRDFSMSGAVDLGARQAAAQAPGAGVAGAAGGGSPYVFEVTDATFNTDVVARSQAAPVIVDLWAEWCEPCKQLGPVLERLANEAAGDWLLAKVDVDANPQLSAALQVQSIPMVVAVIGGQLVDGFLGALPEAQVRQWIGQILQVADQLGMPARSRESRRRAARPGTTAPARPARPGAGAAAAAAGPAASGPAAWRAPPRCSVTRGSRPRRKRWTPATSTPPPTRSSRCSRTRPGIRSRAWLAQVDLIRRVDSYDRAKAGGTPTTPNDARPGSRATSTWPWADEAASAAVDRPDGLGETGQARRTCSAFDLPARTRVPRPGTCRTAVRARLPPASPECSSAAARLPARRAGLLAASLDVGQQAGRLRANPLSSPGQRAGRSLSSTLSSGAGSRSR